MSFDITKYKATYDKDETDGIWFQAPNYVFGIDSLEYNKLPEGIQFRLRHYPDKLARSHTRKVTKNVDFMARRKRQSNSLTDVAEKLRELKYEHVI